jgi:hypothetical protein
MLHSPRSADRFNAMSVTSRATSVTALKVHVLVDFMVRDGRWSRAGSISPGQARATLITVHFAGQRRRNMSFFAVGNASKKRRVSRLLTACRPCADLC